MLVWLIQFVFFFSSCNCFLSLSYRQIDVPGNRKAVVIHIPYRLRKAYRKIYTKLVRELEKKFSGKVIKDYLVLSNFPFLLIQGLSFLLKIAVMCVKVICQYLLLAMKYHFLDAFCRCSEG